MNNKIILESLSMDLIRVAKSLYRKADNTADVFAVEALKRISELDHDKLRPYIVKILNNIENTLKNNNGEEKAEDALMYSTRIRNYTQKFCR